MILYRFNCCSNSGDDGCSETDGARLARLALPARVRTVYSGTTQLAWGRREAGETPSARYIGEIRKHVDKALSIGFDVMLMISLVPIAMRLSHPAVAATGGQGQRRQLVEQLVVAGKIAGAAHFLGDLHQPPLGGGDRRRQVAGLETAEARERVHHRRGAEEQPQHRAEHLADAPQERARRPEDIDIADADGGRRRRGCRRSGPGRC